MSSLARCLNLYVGTGSGLIGTLILSVFIYVVWGVAWFQILQHFIDDEDIGEIHSAFISVGIIFGIVYSTWLFRAFDGYTTAPSGLKNTLLSVYNVHSIFLSSIRTANNLSDSIAANITWVHIHLDELLFFSFRLYIDHDKDVYEAKVVTEPGLKRYKHTEGHRCVVNTSSVSSAAYIHDLEILIRRQLYQLRESNAIYDTDEILKALNQVTDRIQGNNINLTIQEPPYVENHLLFILFIFFFFVAPFNIYVQSRSLMPYAYPLMLFLFVTPYLMRKWLGDALSYNNPFGTAKYFRYRHTIRESMAKDYLLFFGGSSS